MKKFNLKSIMNEAWRIVKKTGATISNALRIAWANAKTLATAIAAHMVEEEVHTHFGWTSTGFEVIHGEHCVFQIEAIDPTTKKGTRIRSYFVKSQVAPIAE